ncbi:MAG: hypothetical protein ACWGO1_13735 [Anaerolineales bacterium]
MAERSAKPPREIRLAQWLFYLNAVIWLVFGVTSLLRLSSTGSTAYITLLVIAVLMLGNAAAMLLAGWGLGRRSRWLYFFAMAVLAVNILLTFTDQFGIFDLLTLLIDIGVLTLLVMGRRLYFPVRTGDRR